MDALGRSLIGLGLILAAVGLVLVIGAHWGLPFGRLPGDIRIERPGFRLYVPITTGLVLSGVLSLALWLLSKLR
ncbi:MAG TPA: DUF2905 domain-containing protein [Myxococcota bacterium]|nr:DUF2905 domain-containing protein [Myxococcota bacterium]